MSFCEPNIDKHTDIKLYSINEIVEIRFISISCRSYEFRNMKTFNKEVLNLCGLQLDSNKIFYTLKDIGFKRIFLRLKYEIVNLLDKNLPLKLTWLFIKKVNTFLNLKI